MADILIRRGPQANVGTLTLKEGEMAVALDTGNVYIGTTAGNRHINPTGGTADVAKKLETARNFSIIGDGNAPVVSFNGESNVALTLALATQSGLTAGTYTKLTVNAKGLVTGASNITLSDISGLGTAASKNTGKAAGNVVILESDGKIDASLIPSLAITDVFEASSQAAMLALSSAGPGDICVRSDESKSYILKAAPASTLANWVWLQTPDCKIISVNGKTGAVTLTASDVGALGTTGDGSNVTAAFTQASTRANIATGEKLSVIFGKLMKWFADLKTVAFTGAYSDLSGAPTTMTPTAHASTATTYGVADATNYGHAMAGSATPIVAGTGSAGAVNGKFANEAHVHPAQTSVSGNAGTATKLATARTIALSGGATATGSFDGSANLTLSVTALDASKLSGTIDGGTF